MQSTPERDDLPTSSAADDAATPEPTVPSDVAEDSGDSHASSAPSASTAEDAGGVTGRERRACTLDGDAAAKGIGSALCRVLHADEQSDHPEPAELDSELRGQRVGPALAHERHAVHAKPAVANAGMPTLTRPNALVSQAPVVAPKMKPSSATPATRPRAPRSARTYVCCGRGRVDAGKNTPTASINT